MPAAVPRSEFPPGRRESLAAVVLLLAASSLFLVKVFTADYGTHLAIGRAIFEARSIPGVEFLNHTRLGQAHAYTEWAFQVLLYGVFSLGGTVGVSILCWAVGASTLGFLFLAARARGSRPWIAALAALAFAGVLRIRLQPRPEIFAYLFLSATMYILAEHYFGKRKKAIFLFPLLAALWMNFHPSVMLGFAVSLFFFIDAAASAVVRGEWRWGSLRGWIVAPAGAALAGLLFLGLNPYGFTSFTTPVGLARSQELIASITEMAPVRMTALFPVFVAAACLGVAALLLGAWGGAFRVLDLLLLGFSVTGSYAAARAISLPALLLLPGVAFQAARFYERVVRGERPSARSAERRGGVLSRVACGILAIGAAVLGILSVAVSSSAHEFGAGLTKHQYSQGAVEFVRSAKPAGKMFNFFDIGGFLDWQLHPDYLTFIDGRTQLDPVYMDYNHIVGGFRDWDRVLGKYGAEWIITKAVDSTGNILPLIDRLMSDRGWALVFSDGLALVFVRDTPGNADLIRKHEIPKKRIYNQIVDEVRHGLNLSMPETAAYVTAGNAYASLGNYPEAVWAFRKALEYGDSDYARRAVQMLETRGAR